MWISEAKSWLLDLVFPKFCASCASEGDYLCDACRSNLTFGTPSCLVCRKRNFDGVLCQTCGEKTGIRRFFAAFSYRNPLARSLIHTYKYDGVRELAELFADELTAFLGFFGIRLPKTSILVPIPLHRSRLSERGFNQSELLARALGKRLSLEVALPLRRVKKTEQQIEMPSHKERRSNIEGAFGIQDAGSVSGRTIILVDDVATSGATLIEAARVLREAGCRTVWAITIAKG